MPVKFEAKQGMAQNALIQAVKRGPAPRRGILKACTANAVARLRAGWRDTAARAFGAGVGGKQGAAQRTEKGCRRWRSRGVRRESRRKGLHAVDAALLGQAQQMLQACQCTTQPAHARRFEKPKKTVLHGLRIDADYGLEVLLGNG